MNHNVEPRGVMGGTAVCIYDLGYSKYELYTRTVSPKG